jgi:putative membrane protein
MGLLIAQAEIFDEAFLRHLVVSLVYGVVGLVLFALAFWLMERFTPFSIRKEIAEDQNTALGIVLGAIILGLALIVAAAIHG